MWLFFFFYNFHKWWWTFCYLAVTMVTDVILLPDIFHYLMLALMVEEPLKFPLLWNLLVQPHSRKFHGGLETLHLHACMLSCDSSRRLTFWRALQWSSLWAFEGPQASFYQGRWFRFLHWCHGRNSSQCKATFLTDCQLLFVYVERAEVICLCW